jgi:hypothetical protein
MGQLYVLLKRPGLHNEAQRDLTEDGCNDKQDTKQNELEPIPFDKEEESHERKNNPIEAVKQRVPSRIGKAIRNRENRGQEIQISVTVTDIKGVKG